MSDPELSTESRLNLIEQEQRYLRGELQAISTSLQGITSRIAEIGKPNWSTFIGLAGLMFPVIAGGYFFVTLSTQNLVAPLVSKAERSEMDRSNLNVAVANLDDRLSGLTAEVKSNEAKISAQLVEIETQFSSAAQLANMRAAGRQQILQLLWQRSYGEPLPDGEYYYNMSQTRSHPGATK